MTTASQEKLSNGYGAIADDKFEDHAPPPAQQMSSSRAHRITVWAGLAMGLFVFFAFLNKDSAPAVTPTTIGSTEKNGVNDDNLWDVPSFIQQEVDHFSKRNKNTFQQRYYESDKYWAGPGHPIFMVMGGEGPAWGLFYPFVNDHLAKKWEGYVIQPEHRFYGFSQPLSKIKHNDDFVGLLTPEQAMQDALHLLEDTQKKLGCSTNKSSKDYCPVITVGGSYPGFLAAMLRIVHPDKVDMAYASSSPLPLYAQDMDPNAFYDIVADSVDRTSPGCSEAVRSTLRKINDDIISGEHHFTHFAEKLDVCVRTLPEYINTKEVFAQELMMIIAAAFADFNMGNYPPSDHTDMARACHIFQDATLNPYEKVDELFDIMIEAQVDDCGFDVEPAKNCGFDFLTQIPGGPNGTVSSGDWTGGGNGVAGLAWDFQTCSDLVVQAGFSEKSMFPVREWTYEWLTQHCQSRFGRDPAPSRLVDKFYFQKENLSSITSHIIFTNGLNDGWSAGSILESLSDTLIAINIPSGAHHSDLSGAGPSERDPPDMWATFGQVTDILGTWLDELKASHQ
jgi:pimeloyl-ACP methyl ester carboxylesterase